MPDYYYYNGNSQRGGGFMSSIPTVTRNLIIINVIVFIATLINENFMVATFAMFYPTSQYFHFCNNIPRKTKKEFYIKTTL